ncbi:MAG: CarD family transcriptional regulator, partial [Spirochaetales bacterium]|nr:CarD family transcriptional regulator [Spirochaetales bacterium]
MDTSNINYKIGQHVVYPLQGVGIIKDINEKKFKGNSILYYTIYLDISDMTVMIPVDNAQNIGIRPIVSANEAEE